MRRRPELFEPLIEALKRLPREGASEDLAERVIEARRNTTTSPSPLWVMRLAIAGALLFAIVVTTVQYRRHADRAQREAVLRQHALLRQELADLERRVSSPPTLYLATGRDYDVVLSLEPWIAADSIQPATVLGPSKRH